MPENQRGETGASGEHRPLRLGLLRCDDPIPELRSICGTYSDMFADVIARVDPSVQMDTFSLPDDEWPDDLDAYDGWMTTGTRASVYDDVPWISRFADFVRQLHAEGRKMFGVCFGHQMIAHALGGTVQRASHGWTVGANAWKIHERRPWMDPPTDEIRLIHSHQDQVLALPPGGVALAGADRCPIAMLAVGEHLVGLQGHPEFQPEFVGPLYESRTELLGADAVAEAKASLAAPCNQELVAGWMLRFFAGSHEVDLSDFGLFDPAVQQCPHAYYAKMRESAPVFEAAAGGAALHLVTRYDDVLEVVRDPGTFSSRFDVGGRGNAELARRTKELYEAEGGYDRVGTMLTADPPEHTRFRRLVSKAFTPKVVNDLEPAVREIAAALIDEMLAAAAAAGDSVDFVEAFAVPLPVAVIARALNVPEDRLADFKRWSDASIAGIGTNISVEERLEAEREVIEFQKYFAEQLERRRTEPQDDLLTNLLNARIDREGDDVGEAVSTAPLTIAEMLSIIQQLLVAGNETTTKMLTEMLRLLAEHPAEWEALRSDPSRASAFVEETLRLSTPTQGMFRVVKKDARLAGVDLPAGAHVVVMFSSANRDRSVFEDADSFCPMRDGVSNHVAFGRGIHFCLGAALARLEGRVAAEELSQRLRSVTLSASNDFEYHPSFLLRGLKRLDIQPEPA